MFHFLFFADSYRICASLLISNSNMHHLILLFLSLNFMGKALYDRETHTETESRSYPGQASAKLQPYGERASPLENQRLVAVIGI